VHDETQKPTTDPYPLAYSACEAARAIGISERLLWAKTKSGEIPHRRVGTRVIYPVALLQKWLVEEDEGGKS
jgi:hypothetical protein